MSYLDEGQTLIEHLTELRTRLMYAIAFIFLGFLASWSFSEIIFDFIRLPISPHLPNGLVFTAPMDKFLAHIKVSVLSGIILSSPFWLYQVWKFIAPGLLKDEKKYGLTFIFVGSFLFLTGIAFVYYVVYPQTFGFLMNFGGETDKPMITISSYLSFFMTTSLAFGVAFEMPLILTILGMMGVIDHQFLASKRRYAIVVLAALSAMLTPPDILSMVLMLIPMTLLYEISVLMVRWTAKKSAKV